MKVRILAAARVWSVVLATLVFWGMNGQAIAALFCASPECGKVARASAPPPQAKHGCCKEKAELPRKEPKGEDSCCCKVEAPKDVTFTGAALVVPVSFELPILTACEIPVVVAPDCEAAAPIHHFTDASPPLVALDSVRGRAPPSA